MAPYTDPTGYGTIRWLSGPVKRRVDLKRGPKDLWEWSPGIKWRFRISSLRILKISGGSYVPALLLSVFMPDFGYGSHRPGFLTPTRLY